MAEDERTSRILVEMLPDAKDQCGIKVNILGGSDEVIKMLLGANKAVAGTLKISLLDLLEFLKLLDKFSDSVTQHVTKEEKSNG